MTNCYICSKQTEPPDQLKCTYCCNIFHYRCGGISKISLKVLNENDSIFWTCDSCKHLSTMSVITMLQEQMLIIKEHDKLIRKICENRPGGIYKHEEGGQKTYSTMLQSNSAVIIKPKNQAQKNNETKVDILQNIDPVEKQIMISSVKNIKNGGVVVGCGNVEEVKKFKEIAKDKLSEKYEIRDVKGLNPRIRVVGITEKYADDILVNHIKYQNKYLLDEQFDCIVIKFWPTKKNKDVFQAILQTDIDSYNAIMSRGGKLFVGYDYCDVYDSIIVRRCYNCNGYNHISSQCNNKQSCPRCADEHELKYCPADSRLNCSNCAELKKKDNSIDVSTNHAAWDSKCPVYCQKVDEFKSKMYMAK